MAGKKKGALRGLLLIGLFGVFAFTGCGTMMPKPPEEDPGPVEKIAENTPVYAPVTRDIVNQINNKENMVIINSKSVIRPEELQYYISKDIRLERSEKRPVLEINAKGELVQWDITTEEHLSIREGTGGELRVTELNTDTDLMTLRICFDYDERLVLDFRQDAGMGNRFYLVYTESEDAKKINYGSKEYGLFFSETIPQSAGSAREMTPEEAAEETPADPAAGEDAAEVPQDDRPYLRILVYEVSDSIRIERTIDGRYPGN
jgi:hypothetical protein